MAWTSDEFALAAAGVLLFLAAATVLHPRVRLLLLPQFLLATGSGLFLAAAVASAEGRPVPQGPLRGLLPLLAAMVWVLVAKDALRTEFAVRLQIPRVHAPAATKSMTVHQRAQDPTTPASVLADLAYGEPSVRVAVAANPSTPASVLAWLASHGEADVVKAISLRSQLPTAKAGPN